MDQTENQLPYVILIGDVGAGKSTLVEKITDYVGWSSNSSVSATRSSIVCVTIDGRLLICDTPGANPMKESFEHNMWIAQAMNYRAFNRLMIVVKAETRIDTVMDHVKKYVDNLLDLDYVLAICVTHMDQVNWTKEEFTKHLHEIFGLKDVVFTGMDTSAETLINGICKLCTNNPLTMTVDDKNFFRFFKVGDNNFKILKSIKHEVNEMLAIKQQFFDTLNLTAEADKADLTFEFQTWIKEEIICAQKRVSENNTFTFRGENTGNEAGHIASLTNQLRSILYEVRIQVLSQQPNHGVLEARKCPYCGRVWVKVEGCDGSTTCGELPFETRESQRGVMCHFQFVRNQANLQIRKLGESEIAVNRGIGIRTGCGRSITWKEMQVFPLPEEVHLIAKINTYDLDTLHDGAKDPFYEKFHRTKNTMPIEYAGDNHRDCSVIDKNKGQIQGVVDLMFYIFSWINLFSWNWSWITTKRKET